jgi:hypothetical protein
MPIPALALLGLGAGANLAGSLLNRPQRQDLDINGILARLSDRENRMVNSLVGRQASIAGQNMAAQGIHGPAVGQVIGGIEAPIRSESLGRQQDMASKLEQLQSALNHQYKMDKGNWWDKLLGDLGGTAGAFATNQVQMGAANNISQMDEEFLKKLQALFSSDPRILAQAQAGYGAAGADGINGNSLFDFTQFRDYGRGMRPQFGG